MKAAVKQQLSLLKLAELDAELARLAYRTTHLPEQQNYQRIHAEHTAAHDRLQTLRIAAEDLDTQVSRLEAEIDAVRQREERDRSLLGAGTADAKRQSELQHELQTLQNRQASLEDSLLELMERREELTEQQAAESAAIATLHADLTVAEQDLAAVRAEINQTRQQGLVRRDELVASLDSELVAVYERQRTGGGPGAGPLQGHRCGACRLEIGRGDLARISAAADDDVMRCPECGAILLRVKSVTG